MLLLGRVLPQALHRRQRRGQLRRGQLCDARTAPGTGPLTAIGRCPTLAGPGAQVAQHQLVTERLGLHRGEPVFDAANARIQLAALALGRLRPRQAGQRDRPKRNRCIGLQPQAGGVEALGQAAEQDLARTGRHLRHALHQRRAWVQGDSGDARQHRLRAAD
jgi:hypothetical protein